MSRHLFYWFFAVATLPSCHSSPEPKSTQPSTLPVNDSIHATTPQSELDTSILQQLRDSGGMVNGLKEGLWVEYSIDTSLMQHAPKEMLIGDQRVPYTPAPVLIKQTGSYVKSYREGVWTTYKSHEQQPPFEWHKYAVTNYEADEKHGEEIIYQGFGDDQKPLAVRSWKNGFEHGIGKLYYYEPPFNLQKQYYAEYGKLWPMEFYYLGGKLQSRFIDTTINGQKLKFFKDYFENGKLKKSGYYLDKTAFGEWTTYYDNGKVEIVMNYADGKLSGPYKYYYKNGQLWTERIYKNGALMEVVSNFNKQGTKQNPGTLKNGTGTLNLYDEDGKLLKTMKYIDGWTEEE